MAQSSFGKALGYLGCLSIAFSTTILASTSAVVAQETQWDRVFRLLQEQDTRNRQIEAEVTALRAEREAERRAQVLSSEEGREQAKELATAIREKAPAVLEVLNQVPEDHLPNGLKERMVGCADTIQTVSSKVLDGELDYSEQNFDGCSPNEVRQILRELEETKQKTQEAWAQCRDAVLKTGKVSSSSLPSDVFGVARGESETNQTLTENLKVLKEQLSDAGEDVTKCADDLSDLYDQAVNQENAASAMAAMMNMAATVCASSGANPYVCGAAFLVAILASLFSDGGGDGDGDGKSDGDGVEGDGSSDVAGVSGGKGTGSEPKPVSQPTPPSPVIPGIKPIEGVLDGKWSCGFEGLEWTCAHTTNVQKTFQISADRLVQAEINTAGLKKSNAVLRSILSEGRGTDIAFCANDAEPFKPVGLIAYEGDRYFAMNIRPNPASPDNLSTMQIQLVDFTSGEPLEDGARNPDVQCKAIVP